MAGAKIGALHVSLGLDTASFDAGMARSQGGLKKWQGFAIGAFAAVAAAGVAMGVAIGKSVGDAIGHFDKIGKSAQRVGLTTEALSRLEYAAKLSDVSLEGLSTALQRVSRNMADVASGKGGAAKTAFDALGIAVTDASGKLRGADAVMADVADKFSRMEDGATKTALAQQIFGRAGAELIPMLNAGRDGLKQMADEADRLGVTISTKSSKEAERFRDNITRVQQSMQGVVNTIAEAALPVLNYLAEYFVKAAGNGELLEGFAQGFVFVLKSLVSAIAVTATAVRSLFESVRVLMSAVAIAQTGMHNWGAALDFLQTGFSDIGLEIQATTEFLDTLWNKLDLAPSFADKFKSMFGGGGGGAIEIIPPPKIDFKPVLAETDSFAKQFADKIKSATGAASFSFDGLAGDLSGVLGKMFGESKAFAVAEAVLAGVQGVAKSLGAYPFPFNIGMAALHGAAALTALMNVKSVGPTSSSMPGGGSVSTPSVSTPDAGGLGTSVNIAMHGESFGRQAMQNLFDGLSDALADKGIKFVTSPIGG